MSRVIMISFYHFPIYVSSFQPRNVLQNKLVLALGEVEVLDLNRVREEALQSLKKEQTKQKERFDRKPTQHYQVENVVLIRRKSMSVDSQESINRCARDFTNCQKSLVMIVIY